MFNDGRHSYHYFCILSVVWILYYFCCNLIKNSRKAKQIPIFTFMYIHISFYCGSCHNLLLNPTCSLDPQYWGLDQKAMHDETRRIVFLINKWLESNASSNGGKTHSESRGFRSAMTSRDLSSDKHRQLSCNGLSTRICFHSPIHSHATLIRSSICCSKFRSYILSIVPQHSISYPAHPT